MAQDVDLHGVQARSKPTASSIIAAIAAKRSTAVRLAADVTATAAAAVVEPTASVVAAVSAAPSAPLIFSDAIDLERGSVMMLFSHAGDKRTAAQSGVDAAVDDEEPPEGDANPYTSTKALLVSAVRALQAWKGDRDVTDIHVDAWQDVWTSNKRRG